MNLGGQLSPRHSCSLQRGTQLQLSALAWAPKVAMGPLICAAVLPPGRPSPTEGPASLVLHPEY